MTGLTPDEATDPPLQALIEQVRAARADGTATEATVPASRQRSSTVQPPVRCSNDARRSESGPRSPSPSSKGTNARSMRGA